MAKTLKTIKIVFSVDVDKIQRNLKALGASVSEASKKVDQANKNIVDANEDVAKSNQRVARSTDQVADAAARGAEEIQKSNRALDILGTSLRLVQGGLEVAGAGLQSLGAIITGSFLLAVKFHKQIGILDNSLRALSGAVVKAGGGLQKLGLTIAGVLLNPMVSLIKLNVRLMDTYPRLAAVTGRALFKLIQLSDVIIGMIVVSGKWLASLKPINISLAKTTTSLAATRTAAAGLLGTLVKTGDQMPRVNKAWQKMFKVLTPVALGLRKVGVAVVPVVARLTCPGIFGPIET